jgi:WD40 repeat protein
MSIPCVSSVKLRVYTYILKTLMWKGLTSRVLKGHTGYVFCVNYNSEGTQLVSGDCDGDVKIWNTAKGERNVRPRSLCAMCMDGSSCSISP